MAKCLYFRQSMSSGSGGDEESGTKNNDNSGSSEPGKLATAEDLARLGLSPYGEMLDSEDQSKGLSIPIPSSGSSSSIATPSTSRIKSEEFFGITPSSDNEWSPYAETPSLADAILETEFLKSIGIHDNSERRSSKMDTSDLSSVLIAPSVMDSYHSMSSDSTLIDTTPPRLDTPKSESPPIDIQAALLRGLNFPPDETYQSDMSSNCSSQSDTTWRQTPPHPKPMIPQPQAKLRSMGTFRALGSGTGLEPIPEDSITEAPAIYQPLIPPPVPKPATTSYNISFPTTLQHRPDRFDFWRSSTASGKCGSFANGSAPSPAYSSPGAASPNISHSPISCSPFHGALSNSNWDPSDLQPMNIIEETHPKGLGGKSKTGNKRARNVAPVAVKEYEESDGGVSGRKGRRDSHGGNSAENKRRDSIKCGLEDLQRMLPHIGKPEEEKMSQASVLFEAGKFINQVKGDDAKVSDEIEAVKKQIDDLNNEIESFQNQLPINGAPLLPKVMTTKTLADQFHDHVVQKTLENWEYWVFVNITGHLVHSFDQTVSAATLNGLENTSIQWMNTNLTLQQLRKDAYRKLAKLCAKTSIVETPSKLPEEALGFVSRGERGYSAKNFLRRKEPSGSSSVPMQKQNNEMSPQDGARQFSSG
eukprot:maker-scaffold590_size129399-snap-gene-0.36 protein:Tk08103 transcript:maker-scaffold590_size129399-snap-gene-0.36-mRNA-1 annotation:"hypothetical protein CAPTEDRAFT_219042"